MSSSAKPKIAISACLLGENVRFNGGHKQSLLCSQTLADYFDFVPLCPEVAIGLGIPANRFAWWATLPTRRLSAPCTVTSM